MFPAHLYPAPQHLPKLGKAHRVASSVDHGEESKTIMFFDFVGLLKFNSYFTSVDGTSDNGSLPVSGKVVPQAPDEEVYYRIKVVRGLPLPQSIYADFIYGRSRAPPLRLLPFSAM